MNKQLKDMIENLIENILDYESDTFSSSARNIDRDTAERMVAYFVDDFIIDQLDGYDMDMAFNHVKNHE